MSMKRGIYNPANHGYAAKTWECLRRNDCFRDEINTFRIAVRSKQSPQVKKLAKQHQNPFPAQVFLALACRLDPGDSSFRTAYARCPVKIEDSPWPDLPALLRQCLKSAVRLDFEPLLHLKQPPVDPIGMPLALGNEEQQAEFLDWAKSIPTNCNEYTIVAVPKVVRDTQRRKACKKALMELLPKALHKARKLNPSGSALGSPVEWKTYLFVESQVRCGFSKLKAWESAAVKFYGDQLSLTSDTIPAYAEELKRVATRRMSIIEKHVHRIEEAIRSIYP